MVSSGDPVMDALMAKGAELFAAQDRAKALENELAVANATIAILNAEIQAWKQAAEETGRSDWSKAQWRRLAMLAKHSKERREGILKQARTALVTGRGDLRESVIAAIDAVLGDNT